MRAFAREFFSTLLGSMQHDNESLIRSTSGPNGQRLCDRQAHSEDRTRIGVIHPLHTVAVHQEACRALISSRLSAGIVAAVGRLLAPNHDARIVLNPQDSSMDFNCPDQVKKLLAMIFHSQDSVSNLSGHGPHFRLMAMDIEGAANLKKKVC